MIYVVLGMHKSGTSLAAEILHKSGISMVTTDQVGTYEDGAYYERQDCYQLNMAILGWSDEELLYRKSELTLTPVHAAQMQTIIAENEALGRDWGLTPHLKRMNATLCPPLFAQRKRFRILCRTEEVEPITGVSLAPEEA